MQVIGIPAPHLTTDIESKKLSHLLTELAKLHVCPAVADPTVQEQAGPPDEKKAFFKHIGYTLVEGLLQQHSTVRSNQCQLLVTDEKL